MKHARFFIMFVSGVMIVAVVSCSLPLGAPPTPAATPSPTPKPTSIITSIITHPKPNFTSDLDKFREAGCSVEAQGSTYWNCEDNSPVTLLGCESLAAYKLFGALTPPYPIMFCYAFDQAPPNELIRYYKELGCMRPFYKSYVMFKDNTFQLVSSKPEFRMLFAPITSPDEALSYALLTTGMYADYSTELDPNFKYLTEEIENTYVKETSDGYIVHLFDGPFPPCSCGTHTVNMVNVLVTKGGEITIIDSKPAYQYEMCID